MLNTPSDEESTEKPSKITPEPVSTRDPDTNNPNPGSNTHKEPTANTQVWKRPCE